MKFRILASLFCASLFTTIVYAQTVNDELLAATRKSNVEAVRELLAKGADPNAKSPYGATPLFFACDRGNLEIVKILIERGADINVKDTFYNSTAVGWAVSKNHVAIVKLLLEKGANSKQTVMRSAINEEKPDIIRMLLEMGGFKPEEMTDFLTLYTCSNNGVLTCYDARTGERIYQQRVAGQSSAFTASPIAADGKLYFAGEDGDVFVVKAGPKYELIATNPIGEVMMATPAISEGMIFVRTISHVYGIADSSATKQKAAK